jgi:hypothetical protein
MWSRSINDWNLMMRVDVLQAEKKSKKPKSATPKVKTDWSLRARFRAAEGRQCPDICW